MSESASGEASDSCDASGKEFSCAACGDTFDSQRALSIHETKAHGGPVDGDGKECPGCDRRFSCQRGLISHLTGDNSCDAGYECEKCGRTHPTERGLSHHKKETHNIDTRPEIACTICGETRRVDPNYLQKANRHFCSNDCWKEWAQENRTGDDNPMWEGGGRLDYGTNWQKKRVEVLERDNYKCQSCGVSESNADHTLHVHHIQPLRSFDESENPHTLDNLVSLCISCHKRWEGVPLKPQLL